MHAKLIDTMGDDLKVVNAARVSFSKQVGLEIKTRRNERDNLVHYEEISDKDKKLIKYLATHNHWTPFGHCQATFHVKTPIFVARQLVKHQIGLVWNEVSRRYVSDEPEFYWPEKWRLRPDHIKQGSGDEVLDELETNMTNEICMRLQKECVRIYNSMIEDKIAPEQARMVLPLNMYTEWHWTGSLMAFARVCQLRLDPHAQFETQLVARDIDKSMSKAFPVSWTALMGREDPTS